MTDKELITVDEVAVLCGGKNKNFVFKISVTDPTFPAPAKIGKRGRGKCYTYWLRSDVDAWLKVDATRKRDKSGRRVAIRAAHRFEAGLEKFDNIMAQMFIFKTGRI